MPEKVAPKGAVRLYLMFLGDPSKLVDQTALEEGGGGGREG
jgi:hypothetical protein